MTSNAPMALAPAGKAGAANAAPLDLFSISQKVLTFDLCFSDAPRAWCKYGAPMFAYAHDDDGASNSWGVTQGNCNHWDCPRCGPGIARKNYGRIIEGARHFAQHNQLYFLTITCRGKEMSKSVADEKYLLWTNRLLSTLRASAKKSSQAWAYAAVTERQKRGHPHSHFLTTFCPPDARMGLRKSWAHDNAGKRVYSKTECIRSDWLQERVISAGLGEQYDLTPVQNTEACSRYVAKYLFKQTLLSVWPKNWRRVRYSQNWPQLPERNTDAKVLLTAEDWYYLAEDAPVIIVSQDDTQAIARAADGLFGHDTKLMAGGKVLQSGHNRTPQFDRFVTLARCAGQL